MTEKFERALAWAAVTLFALFFLGDTFASHPVLSNINFWFVDFYGKSRGEGIPGELSKVFDVCSADGCLHRNRPVNFLLWLVDVKFMIAANRFGPWGFRSIVRILSIGGTCVFLARAIRALAPEVPRWTAAALGAFFAVTGQALASSVMAVSPGKPWAAFSAALFFDAWLRARTARAWLAFGAFACVAVLSDEQAVFILALFAVVAWAKSGWKGLPAAAGGVFAFYLLFGSTLGIWAARHFSNPWRQVIVDYSDPRTYLRMDWPALGLAAKAWLFQAGTVFGSLADMPLAWGAFVIVGGGAWAGWLARRQGLRFRIGAEWMLVAGLFPMVYLMGVRLPEILLPDMIRSTYYLPSTTVWLACALLLVHRWGGLASPASRSRLLLALVVLGTSNLLAQPETKRLVLSDAFASLEHENKLIRELIRDPARPIPRLTNWGRQLVEYARTWAEPGP